MGPPTRGARYGPPRWHVSHAHCGVSAGGGPSETGRRQSYSIEKFMNDGATYRPRIAQAWISTTLHYLVIPAPIQVMGRPARWALCGLEVYWLGHKTCQQTVAGSNPDRASVRDRRNLRPLSLENSFRNSNQSFEIFLLKVSTSTLEVNFRKSYKQIADASFNVVNTDGLTNHSAPIVKFLSQKEHALN